jgi:hypothetical protein
LLNLKNKKMKNIYFTFVLVIGLLFVIPDVNGQKSGPPDPSDDPEVIGETPIGGNAPIGGGTLILLTLGAAYGSKKIYKYLKDNKEELEE